jgi:fatty-acyl-CoA synthase
MSPFIDLLGQDPERPALHIGEVSITRGELKREAQALAGYLVALGFRRGDTLAVWLPDGPAWLQFLFAASQLGVLVVPISTRYRTDDARHVISVARAKAIVVARDFLGVDYAGMAREIQRDLPHVEHVLELGRTPGFFETDGRVAPTAEQGLPYDFLCTFSTSGTTGRPKLAPHDQASIARHCLNVVKAFDIKPGDVMLCALPLNGVLGFIQTISAIAGRAACVLLPVFNATEAARLIEKSKVTHFYGADSMFDPILNIEGAVLNSWRHGGFAEFVGLGQHVTEKAERKLGLRLVGLYGSSECFALMSLQDPKQEAPERALAGGDTASPDISVRVVDAENGEVLREGEPGELQVKGYNVTPGYLNNPEASKQAFTPDGWFRTGDLAYARGRGFVYQARMKDGLRLKGYLVDPGEIESHLMQHGGVVGAQVVGVKLPGEGDVAVAFVRPGPAPSTEPELIAHCRSGIANYKVPRRILFVDEFPQVHGPNGSKITKNKLREMAEQALARR